MSKYLDKEGLAYFYSKVQNSSLSETQIDQALQTTPVDGSGNNILDVEAYVRNLVHELVPTSTINPAFNLSHYTFQELSDASTYIRKYPGEFLDWIGQTIDVTIDNTACTARLVGLCQDDLADGTGKAAMTFICTTTVIQKRMSLNSPTGYADSDLNINLNSSIYSNLSNSLKPYIKQVTKPTSSTRLNTEQVAQESFQAYLFIPSLFEIFGSSLADSKYYGIEGSQYQYWANGGEVKFLSSSSTPTSMDRFWSRTKDSGSSFKYFNSTGSVITDNSYSSQNKVAVSFCI